MIVYIGRQLKKSSNWKFEDCPVKAGHNIPLKHHISFVTDLAANFGCYWFRITPDTFPSFCAPQSKVTVLFNMNLSKGPFLGQVIDLDLQLCTGFDSEHAVLFLCHIFTQRPMTNRKIKRSDGRCFGWQQLLDNSVKNKFSHVLVAASNLQSIKTFSNLELSEYSKSGSMFSSSKPVAASTGSLVDEGWQQLTAILNFGVLKRIQTPWFWIDSNQSLQPNR